MACEMSSRNPYGYDNFENDDNFAGKSQKEKTKDTIPTHMAQNEGPWKRLFHNSTLSSTRHEFYYYDPRAPNDDLDFMVRAKYNHHAELFPEKTDVVLQPETYDTDHGRVLKNRTKVVFDPEPSHPLRVVIPQKERQSIHSISNAVGNGHSDGSCHGYARKCDGGFFGV